MTRSVIWRNLPPFYESPAILCADEHRNKALLPDQDFRFAAENTAIPLGVSEVALAVRHYPVVFAPGELPVPLAVTGLLTGGNLFIRFNDGGWRAGSYIPGYLKQYPFILGEQLDGDEAPLVLDTASPRVIDAGDDRRAIRLFDDDGRATQLIDEAIANCVAAHREQAGTIAFARALAESGLLTEGTARIGLPDGRTQTLQGFATVDSRAYRALPDRLLRQWLAAGWLDVIALHLASQHNWSVLVDLFMEREADGVAA